MERKAEPLVALIVGWVARLQIRGGAFGVDARQVLCEERHAEAVPPLRRMRTQETQARQPSACDNRGHMTTLGCSGQPTGGTLGKSSRHQF
jgi:hypothetical protein